MSRVSTVERQVPFSAVDEAIYLLDNDVEPWGIQLEAQLPGHFDADRLRSAFAAALAAHPMGRARKAPARPSQRRLHWDITARADLDAVSVVDCGDDPSTLAAARADLHSTFIALAESPPLRLRLARTASGDIVMINAKHAAMDGFGVLAILRSLTRAYRNAPDPAPDVDFDTSRDVRRLLAAQSAGQRRRRRSVVADKLADLARSTARLAVDGADGAAGYGFHHLSLSQATTAALADVAGGTVNDVLMAALHQAIGDWNAGHDAATGRVGVLMAVNLRPEHWRQQLAANFSLDARVTSRAADRRNPARLLDAVAAQTKRIKTGGTGAALIEVVGALPSLPVAATEALAPLMSFAGGRLADTALLSNLGRVDDPPTFGGDAGDTVAMWFSAPARMPLGLSVGAVTVAGALHLSYRYRHPQFDDDAAARFAQCHTAAIARYRPPPT